MLWADSLPFADVFYSHTVIRPSSPQNVIPNTTVEWRCGELDERNASHPRIFFQWIQLPTVHCTSHSGTVQVQHTHYAGGPRRPPPPQLHLRRSRDLAHTSIPLAQTPWGLTGRAWLQAGAQQAVIAVDPSFKSLGIDFRNVVVRSQVTLVTWLIIHFLFTLFVSRSPTSM